jgi:hypothetical protein
MSDDEIADESIEVHQPRRLCDVLAIGVLAVLSLRIVFSIAGGFIRATTHGLDLPSESQRVANIIEWFAGFGDGPGLLFAGAALALVWWSVDTPPESEADTDAHVTRSLRFCGWLTTIWVWTSLAAVANAVAVSLSDWDGGGLRWAALIGQGGFELCYGLLGAVGIYATRQLRWAVLLIEPEHAAELPSEP